MSKHHKVESIALVLVDIDEQCMRNILMSSTKSTIQTVILCGSTPTPLDNEKFDCEWFYVKSDIDAVLKLSNKGYEIVIGQFNQSSELLSDANFSNTKIAGVIGNISEKMASLTDRSLHLPLHNHQSNPSPSIMTGALLHEIFCRREAAVKNRSGNSSSSFSFTGTIN